MKSSLLLTLVVLGTFIQCSPDKSESVYPTVNHEQTDIQLMKELVPQLTGTWAMKQIRIKYQSRPAQIELKISKDTTLIDLATLTLAPASVQFDPTRTRYEGNIQYSSKTYPVRFDLLAGSLDKKGPKAYFLLDYNFPVRYSVPTEKEAYFLEQIGLLFETFALDTTTGAMTWRGLNRGIEQIDLIKN